MRTGTLAALEAVGMGEEVENAAWISEKLAAISKQLEILPELDKRLALLDARTAKLSDIERRVQQLELDNAKITTRVGGAAALGALIAGPIIIVLTQLVLRSGGTMK